MPKKFEIINYGRAPVDVKKDNCPICLDPFNSKNTLVHYTCCNKYVCFGCYSENIRHSNLCPFCRSIIDGSNVARNTDFNNEEANRQMISGVNIEEQRRLLAQFNQHNAGAGARQQPRPRHDNAEPVLFHRDNNINRPQLILNNNRYTIFNYNLLGVLPLHQQQLNFVPEFLRPHLAYNRFIHANLGRWGGRGGAEEKNRLSNDLKDITENNWQLYPNEYNCHFYYALHAAAQAYFLFMGGRTSVGFFHHHGRAGIERVKNLLTEAHYLNHSVGNNYASDLYQAKKAVYNYLTGSHQGGKRANRNPHSYISFLINELNVNRRIAIDLQVDNYFTNYGALQYLGLNLDFTDNNNNKTMKESIRQNIYNKMSNPAFIQ